PDRATQRTCRAPLAPPVTAHRPSGESMPTHISPPEGLYSTDQARPLGTEPGQSLTVRSTPPENSPWPSGRKARAVTPGLWANIMFLWDGERGSSTRRKLSMQPLTSVVPRGEKATAWTASGCCCIATCLPVFGFHRRRVASSLPLASSVPS